MLCVQKNTWIHTYAGSNIPHDDAIGPNNHRHRRRIWKEPPKIYHEATEQLKTGLPHDLNSCLQENYGTWCIPGYLHDVSSTNMYPSRSIWYGTLKEWPGKKYTRNIVVKNRNIIVQDNGGTKLTSYSRLYSDQQNMTSKEFLQNDLMKTSDSIWHGTLKEWPGKNINVI